MWFWWHWLWLICFILIIYIYTYLALNNKKQNWHSEEKEAELCVKHYSMRCLEPFPRQALNVFLTNMAKSNAQRCTKAGIQGKPIGDMNHTLNLSNVWNVEHLENYECVDSSFEALKACTNQSIHEMMRISKAPSDDQIPIGCWWVFSSLSHMSLSLEVHIYITWTFKCDTRRNADVQRCE